MIDSKLEQRKNAFQKNSVNIVDAREDFRLSLRKQKIDQFIFNKKERILEKKGSEKSSLEIDPEKLNLPAEIINYEITDLNDYYQFLLNLLKSTNLNYIKYGIYLTRKQLTLELNPPVNQFYDLGFVQQLLDVFEKMITDEQAIFEIIWCFVNLTSLQGAASGLLLAPIPMTLFEKVIKNHSHIDILTHLIWLFSHLASDSIQFRNMILASSFYKRIVIILQQTVVNSEVMRQGCWLMGNLMRGKPAPPMSYRLEACKIFCNGCKVPDLSTVINSIWGLYYLVDCQDSTPIVAEIVSSGVASHIVKTLAKSSSIGPLCLKVIGNLLTGDSSDIEELLNYGVIEVLESYLDSPVLIQQKEALWGLSNIGASIRSHVERLITSSAFTKVLEKLKNLSKYNLEIILECVWTLGNAISGCDMELSIKLFEMEVLQIYIHILDMVDNDMILVVALNGLASLFKFGEPLKQLISGDGSVRNPIVEKFCYYGGHVYLEKLMNHKSTEIYNKTDEIVRNFFNFEDYDAAVITYDDNTKGNNDGNNNVN